MAKAAKRFRSSPKVPHPAVRLLDRYVADRPKVFCVGMNKTGTTSLKDMLKRFGYTVASQARGELLLDAWLERDFAPIVRFCRSADAFQDIPFSLDYSYQALDAAFPGSRFILSIRDSPQQWFESLCRFHAKVLGTDGPPTEHDLRASTYREPGWLWKASTAMFGVASADLYDEDLYTRRYEAHNDAIVEHFARRPADLLVLNLAQGDAPRTLADFLGLDPPEWTTPWLNRSATTEPGGPGTLSS
jgi:hypothetical protein